MSGINCNDCAVKSWKEIENKQSRFRDLTTARKQPAGPPRKSLLGLGNRTAAGVAYDEPERKKDLLRSTIGMADSLLHCAHGCPADGPARHTDRCQGHAQ